MARAIAAFALAAALMIGPTESAAQNVGLTPTQLQRALSSMQDRAVQGDAWAEGKVRELLVQIGQQFDSLDPTTWKSHRSAVAASVFLFSGGVSAPVRRVLARGYFRPADRSLLEAALSFAEGRPAMARQQLAEFDPATADPVLAGPLALVRGSLEMDSDLDQARQFFDWARLLAPGSIFEEAALRRQAIIYADLKQLDKYIRTIESYARRFPASPYGQRFRSEVVSLLEKLADPSKEAELKNIIAVLQRLPESEAQPAMLRLANEYLLSGHSKPADMIAESVMGGVKNPTARAEYEKIRQLVRMTAHMPATSEQKSPFATGESHLVQLENLAAAISRFQYAALRASPSPQIDVRQAETWDAAPRERKELAKAASEKIDAAAAILESE